MGYSLDGLPCHHGVAVFDLLNDFVVTMFPTPRFSDASLCQHIIMATIRSSQALIKCPSNKCMPSLSCAFLDF